MSTITDPTLQREFRHAGLWLGALWDERHEAPMVSAPVWPKLDR